LLSKLLQAIFFLLIVRPLITIVIGLILQGEERLPLKGPAIVAANHNSHLDTLTLMSLWPLPQLNQVRPVAAADYFLSNRLVAWFSLTFMRIIPIERHRQDRHSDPLAALSAALDRGEILLLFPEGSRGEPEQLSRFKTGVSRLVERHPDVPIVPIFMYGLGKALPRGSSLLVPFFADVIIGEWLYWRGSVKTTMEAYETSMSQLAEQSEKPMWE
jgi:1-acyl-sn-glycerol-3-phosphate acyltransferase